MLRRNHSRRQIDRSSRQVQIDKMVRSIDAEFDLAVQTAPKWSICKVPLRLRRANHDAYTPHLVSIGPFHRGKNNLIAMDLQKKQYMLALLMRTGDKSKALNACTAAIFDLEVEARNCYAGGVAYDEYSLAEVLLTDGCFILELFIRAYIKKFVRTKTQDRLLPLFHGTTAQKAWLANDPIFQSEWLFTTVQRDLALLENQMPFFVLQTLFDTLLGQWRTQLPYDFLAGLAFDFFSPALHSARLVCRVDHFLHRKHILNLLFNLYLPSSQTTPAARVRSGTTFLHNATKLKEAGIQLKKASSQNLFDFNFENRVLVIPQLHIHEWTDSFFRNLMAFEHCCLTNQTQYIASYMILMDRLIDTKQDVELLENEGIIINDLGGGEYIINFFRNVCKQVVVKDFYFAGLCQKVEQSYQSLWGRSWQDIRRKHFDTPLKIITWVVGFVVVGATVLQSVYSALQYYQKK